MAEQTEWSCPVLRSNPRLETKARTDDRLMTNDRLMSDDRSEPVECPHDEYIQYDGELVCNSCGEIEKELCYEKEWRFYGSSDSKNSRNPSRCQDPKVDTKNIFKDVEHFQYPLPVVNKANQYYQSITTQPDGKSKILRGDNRKALICACVFYSFKEINSVRCPYDLAKDFGISNFHSALKDFNTWKQKQSTKYEEQPNKIDVNSSNLVVDLQNEDRVYITPLDLVPRILQAMNAKIDHLQGITLIYRKIESNTSDLINKSIPQSVAAGLVYFYFRYQNFEMKRSQFAKVAGLSEITFVKIARDISSTLDIPLKL